MCVYQTGNSGCRRVGCGRASGLVPTIAERRAGRWILRTIESAGCRGERPKHKRQRPRSSAGPTARQEPSRLGAWASRPMDEGAARSKVLPELSALRSCLPSAVRADSPRPRMQGYCLVLGSNEQADRDSPSAVARQEVRPASVIPPLGAVQASPDHRRAAGRSGRRRRMSTASVMRQPSASEARERSRVARLDGTAPAEDRVSTGRRRGSDQPPLGVAANRA